MGFGVWWNDARIAASLDWERRGWQLQPQDDQQGDKDTAATLSLSPVRAEFLQIDLSIFGMD